MSQTMQAVVIHGREDYRLEQIPIPTPGPGEALVKVQAVGICASDHKCYHGAPMYWGDGPAPVNVDLFATPGHEFVGEIVALDDQARARWGVDIGDRVVSEQIVPCWQCRFCRRGQYWMCAPHQIFGFRRQVNGAMAEYMIYPANAIVHKVSPQLPAAHAAFAEPLSCALHAVERAQVGFGDVVVVAGCGPIGLGMIAGVRAKSPAHVIALDMVPAKLDLAAQCGADITVNLRTDDADSVVRDLTEGYGADIYLDATGHPSAVPQGLNLLRRWVAMGRAIVRNPQVFCMDEPLSNLDAKLRVQTRTEIAALQRRLGTTTVYVTHDQVEAMTMGDRVAVLRNGQLQQFATPNELYDKPANAFVAGFIGSPSMNLVTVPITADGVRLGENSTLELERDQLTLLHDAGLKEVTVGIRPEQLDITDSGGIEVVVDLVEDLGSEAYVYTHAGSGVQLVARSDPRTAPKLAETVRLRKHPHGVVHLFHPENGERIG
jgi:threonine dehydrogenase-like Zn-dependent dehydrogenase